MEKEEITKSDVLQVFRTSVGLEGSENRLSSAATTFLKTLEAAGLGEYIVGRGGNETRLELNDEFETVSDQVIGESEEGSNQQVNQERIDFPNKSIAKNIQRSDLDASSSFQVRLELSGDEDPTEIEELIAGVRRGLTRDLNTSDSSEDPMDTVEDNPAEDSKKENSEGSDDGTEEDSSDRSLDTFMQPESETDEE